MLVINLYVYMLLKDIFNLRVLLSVRKSLLIEQMRCFVTMSHFIQLQSFFAYFSFTPANQRLLQSSVAPVEKAIQAD